MNAVVFRLPAVDGGHPRYALQGGATTIEKDAAIFDVTAPAASSDRAMARNAAALFTVGMKETSGNITVEVVDADTRAIIGYLVMNVAGVVRFAEVAR